MSSAYALQKAIFAALAAHSPLTALVGARIHDLAPQPAIYPYITFGQSVLRDAETSSDPGDEHLVTLHVWSRAKSRSEAQDILSALRAALHDQPLTITGCRLVNLRQEFSEARRELDGETVHGLLRLRAVTEPL